MGDFRRTRPSFYSNPSKRSCGQEFGYTASNKCDESEPGGGTVYNSLGNLINQVLNVEVRSRVLELPCILRRSE